MSRYSDNSKRDALICDLHRQGALQKDLSAHFGLHQVRISQILKAHGLGAPAVKKPGLPAGFSVSGMKHHDAAVALEPYVSAARAAAILGTTRDAIIGIWWRAHNGNKRTLAENGVVAVNPRRRPRISLLIWGRRL